MSVMRATTSPIFCDAPTRPCTISFAFAASATAWLAILLDWPTWRLISAIELDSSSAADATVCTLVDASSEADATTPACFEVSSAVADMLPAVD